MLKQYLQKLEFTDKEQTIYLVLAELGVQPASVIARHCKLDRVTTYKHLKKLSERGFVKTYFRDGVQSFGIESFESIELYLKDREEEFKDLRGQFPTVLEMLKSFTTQAESVPRLQVFEGDAGVKGLFRDILFELKEGGLKQLRVLSSNTFEDLLGDVQLGKIVKEFIDDVKERKVSIQLFEATGGLVPERLKEVALPEDEKANLPIVRGTTSIFLVGHTVYLASFKGSQVWLKIKQA